MNGLYDHDLELLALFADQTASAFFEVLLRRGWERGCLRPFSMHLLPSPGGRHDEYWRRLQAIIPPRQTQNRRLRILALWDHHGSGRDERLPAEVEAEAAASLHKLGFSMESCACIALQPELEGLLSPVWERVKDILARERTQAPPTDEVILRSAQRQYRSPIPAGLSPTEALRRHPKEMLEGLCLSLKLTRDATARTRIAAQLSIPLLKGTPEEGRDGGRIAAALVRWFPGPASQRNAAASP